MLGVRILLEPRVLTAAEALLVGSLALGACVVWLCGFTSTSMSCAGTQGLALLLGGALPVAGKAVPLSAAPPIGGMADAWPQRP